MPRSLPNGQCTRIKLNGERCGLPPIKGATVCYSHGGAARQVRAAAERRLAEAKAEEQARKTLDKWSPDASDVAEFDVLEELIRTAQVVVGWRDFMSARLSELQAQDYRYDHRAGEQLRADVALFERGLDRAARLLVDLGKLGLEERRVRVTEAQTAMVAQALNAALKDLGIDAGSPTLVEALQRRLMEVSEQQNAAPAYQPRRRTAQAELG